MEHHVLNVIPRRSIPSGQPQKVINLNLNVQTTSVYPNYFWAAMSKLIIKSVVSTVCSEGDILWT